MNSAEGGRAPEYFGRNGERKWEYDLNGGASDVGSDRQGAEKGSQGESVSDTETDKTMKAFEGLMTFNVIIITTAFYYMFLPFISAMAMILLLNELLDLHDRRRL